MEPYVREAAGGGTEVPKSKSGRKIAAGFAIGCGGLIVLVIVGVAALAGLIWVKKSKYDKVAVPFLESYIVELSSWDPDSVRQYWAPEVLDRLTPEEIERLFLAYRQLGALQSHDPPEFRQVGAHTQVPYSALVTYQIPARFDGGEAMVTVQLVPTESEGMKVWYINIQSEAFLPRLEPPAGAPELDEAPAPVE